MTPKSNCVVHLLLHRFRCQFHVCPNAPTDSFNCSVAQVLSIGKVAKELGFEVISVDLNKKATPTFCTDILEWDYKWFPVGHFDVIWASPPCNIFSHLKTSWIGRELKRFSGQVYTKELMLREQEEDGVPITRLNKEIISYFKPKHYWIENQKLVG